MVIRRPKRRGTYAPLSAGYFNDPAILKVGLQAEVVYVRSLAFSAQAAADGFIHDVHVRLLCRGVRGIGRTCAALTSANLWVRDDKRGGYWVRSWHKWNPSEEAIRAAQEADARAPEAAQRRRKRNASSTYVTDIPRSKWQADTDTDTDTESADRPPPGPGRSAAPPDLTRVREQIAEASRRARLPVTPARHRARKETTE